MVILPYYIRARADADGAPPIRRGRWQHSRRGNAPMPALVAAAIEVFAAVTILVLGCVLVLRQRRLPYNDDSSGREQSHKVARRWLQLHARP